MKKIITFALIIITLLPFLFLFGCGTRPAFYGQKITELKTTQIVDILKNPKGFNGKTVKIEGKITEECPAGGWFMLKDTTGVIFVNLHPTYFAIPQVSGRKVVAQGIVIEEGSQPAVIGKGVEIK